LIPNWLFEKFRNKKFQAILFFSLVILLSNINAIVDYFLHPEIPYFDEEHLIVGGIYGTVSTLLFLFLFSFVRQLETAQKKIEKYEKFLSICSYCKQVKIDNKNPDNLDSWQPIESFLLEKAKIQFSHGICPTCSKAVMDKMDSEEN